MTPEQQEITKRKDEIASELRALFEANMKIADWDIPEADDQTIATLLVEVMQEALDAIKADVAQGKYATY